MKKDQFTMNAFADPDSVGSAEYRAIYETLEDAAHSKAEAKSILEEFISAAQGMLRYLYGNGKDKA